MEKETGERFTSASHVLFWRCFFLQELSHLDLRLGFLCGHLARARPAVQLPTRPRMPRENLIFRFNAAHARTKHDKAPQKVRSESRLWSQGLNLTPCLRTSRRTTSRDTVFCWSANPQVTSFFFPAMTLGKMPSGKIRENVKLAFKLGSKFWTIESVTMKHSGFGGPKQGLQKEVVWTPKRRPTNVVFLAVPAFRFSADVCRHGQAQPSASCLSISGWKDVL